MKRYNVAVVGATGLVGEMMIRVLEERSFPVGSLKPLASHGSLGKKVKFNGKNIAVKELSRDSFADIDFALFSAGGDVSLEYAPVAAKAGAIVIDNTSAFRMMKDVPLVVPEVNGKELGQGARVKGQGRIIANPNCSTIQLVCVLKPIHDKAVIKRVVVSTYQSVSGAGREALEELRAGVLASGGSGAETPRRQDAKTVFPHPIAFNCIPHIDVFEENGYTKEEMKVVNETRKILGDDSINVTCTAVRVPVRVGHSEAVDIETEIKISADEVRKILSKAPGVIVMDDPSRAKYPMAIYSAGKDEVFVGRIREDISCKNGISLWIVADNIRKGAATNAVQIAEMLI